MDKEIIFSIIVVTYNRLGLLKKCLDSFKNQTFKDFELFVVDRGSEPDASGVVSSMNDERFSYIRSSQDVHFCDIGNDVVNKTKGKYLCVFGDDDVIHKSALEIVNAAFDKNKDCDIAVIGSVALYSCDVQPKIFIPSDFSSQSDFPYFKPDLKIFKFPGKEYLQWMLSAQYIGPKASKCFPSWIHPSTFFIRKSENYEKVVKNQKGIMVKPSFDAGYLGVAYYTNMLFINAPLCVIKRGNNVSSAPRRIWNVETQDIKYMPKISHLENRGADSILNVLYLNNIQNEFDIKIQQSLYKKMLRDILYDSVWDKQTYQDIKTLAPYYISNAKHKVSAAFKYMFYVLKALISRRKKRKLVAMKNFMYESLDCTDVLKMLDSIYINQIDNIKKILNG